jgi:UDP-3-O-[3-hydroxymyristoyl] glucosamine N-acyltransferase
MDLQKLAEKLGLEFKGPGDYNITRLRDLEHMATDGTPEENQLYFVEKKKYLRSHPRITEGGAVLVPQSLAGSFPRALIAPDDKIRLAFIELLQLFDNAPTFPAGSAEGPRLHPKAKIAASATVHPGATVMEGAVIGENCQLYPGVVVEPFAQIGDGTILRPNVVISYHCVIGKRCIIHAASVIGADGFGFHDQGGKRYKIPQIGNVTIADDVEIGAGSTVDRAAIETTSIGEHTKIDDQVHIAHNCRVGRYIYIAGQSGLAGSVVMGDGSMISGNVAISDHVTLAPRSIIMGMSGVAKDTEPGQFYFGVPARPAKEAHRMNAALVKLPDLLKRVRTLEERDPDPEPVGV